MSQNDAVLAYLRAHPHSGLTALEALLEIRTFRLAARISDLRAEGHDIYTDLVTTEKGKRIAVYRLREKPVPLTFWDESERRRMLRDDVLEANNPMHWSTEELVTVASQSGIEVRRG